MAGSIAGSSDRAHRRPCALDSGVTQAHQAPRPSAGALRDERPGRQGEQQDNVRGARYGVLAKACFSAGNAGEFEAAIADLVRCGAQAVILRCTEFDSR
jgi:hypothetical protein